MKELVTGGARSGKSSYAEERAKSSQFKVIFIATATADDGEMQDRIKHHQQQRPDHWRLIEEPINLADVLIENAKDDRCIIVDCLTLWVSNLLMQGQDRLDEEKQKLLDCLPSLKGDIYFVTNETGMGIVPMGEMNRRFCDESGWLHQALAKICDRVTLMVAGIPMVVKGEEI